jgi:hypothetical protein
MTAAETKLTWTERCRRDPDLAQSIVEQLQSSLTEADQRIDELELALRRIAVCDWPGPYPQPIFSRADWMQGVAKDALK